MHACLPRRRKIHNSFHRMFTIANTFLSIFLGEMQRLWQHVSTPRKIRRGVGEYLFPWEYLTITPQCLALIRNYIPLSSCLSLCRYICDWCHCRATDNSDGDNLKRLEPKKWRNNARTSRRMSAMSGRRQALGGSSMVDRQLSCRNRFVRERARRSKSNFHKGSGGPSAKIRMHSKTLNADCSKAKAFVCWRHKRDARTYSDLNTLIMALTSVEYFHVCSPWRK